MVRRTIQHLTGRDPAYSGSFGTDRASSVEHPPPKEPRVPARESSRALETVQPVEGGDAPTKPSSGTSSESTPLAPSGQPNNAVGAEDQVSQPSRGKVHVPVRLRPLAEQVDRIAATGLRPRDVLKAAWRKATSGYVLGPDYIPAPSVSRAGGATIFFNTTLTVDSQALSALARVHDPLGVQGGWWLLRGQVEPRFWAAIEDVLAQVAATKAPDGTTS